MTANNTDNLFRVVAVDDDAEMLMSLHDILEAEGYSVETAQSGEDGLRKAESHLPHLFLLDVNLPGKSGLDLASEIKSDPVLKYIPVILLTARDGLDDIALGFEKGADDYITKPFQRADLLARVKAALRTKSLYEELQRSDLLNRELHNRLGERSKYCDIAGNSAAMREVFSLIEKVASASVPILISGESGTGKELVARAIHYQSSRKEGPFIVQNCSAFNDNLLESELFGHVKGAFTGATEDKSGLFEVAAGGTFFLDEVGEMSAAFQAKLLRVIQDGSYIPVGSTKIKHADVRIVAATHRDLKAMVREGKFREDLFYRLNVVSIALPPLRERRIDIPLIVRDLLEKYAKLNQEEPRDITNAALKILSDYSWPGNVRELENEIQRLLLLSPKDEDLDVSYLSKHICQGDEGQGVRRVSGKLKEALEALEKNMIFDALENSGWNKSKASEALGISRSALIAKVKLYGLES